MWELDEYLDRYGNHYGNDYKKPRLIREKPQPIRNVNQELDTYTNWNSPAAARERTIFGEEEKDLFYNYSDRLWESDWNKTTFAYSEAKRFAPEKTAKYFEAMLSLFHDGVKIELRHIIAGCNRSNGYSYLIFGYKYQKDIMDPRQEIQKIIAARHEELKFCHEAVEKAKEIANFAITLE